MYIQLDIYFFWIHIFSNNYVMLCCVVIFPFVIHPDLLFTVLRNLHDDISNLYPTLRVIFIIQSECKAV